MSELIIEIIKNSTLNKNTSTLVESYLLDPPKLPFLTQLVNETKIIYDQLNEYWFYDVILVRISNKNIFTKRTKFKIHKMPNNRYYPGRYWCIKFLYDDN